MRNKDFGWRQSVGLVEYHPSDRDIVLHQSRPVREPFLETKGFKYQI